VIKSESMVKAASRFAGIELDARGARVVARLELPMLVVALLIVPAMIVDGAARRGTALHDIGVVLDWGIWLAFAGELVAMLWVARDRRAYLRRNPLDLLIVLLTPPFLPVSAAVLRVLRLLRLVRIIQLAERVFFLEGLRYAAVMAGTTVLAGGLAFSAVERSQHISADDGLWWAVTTVTTVGYGDFYPKTSAGRLIGVVVMFAGIGFVALVTGAAAERFLSHGASKRASEGEGHEGEVLARLDRITTSLEEINQRLVALEQNGGDSGPAHPPRPSQLE
jgi:voltage-gated potassium channel